MDELNQKYIYYQEKLNSVNQEIQRIQNLLNYESDEIMIQAYFEILRDLQNSQADYLYEIDKFEQLFLEHNIDIPEYF